MEHQLRRKESGDRQTVDQEYRLGDYQGDHGHVWGTKPVQRLRSSITGPGDLPGKTIATVPGSVAAQYLTELHYPVVEITSPKQALDLLNSGKVQAIVYDAPTLEYWAAELPNSNLQVVGPIFRPEKYGIAVPLGSPLRQQINKALLGVYQDGTYEEIYRKWFARGQ